VDGLGDAGPIGQEALVGGGQLRARQLEGALAQDLIAIVLGVGVAEGVDQPREAGGQGLVGRGGQVGEEAVDLVGPQAEGAAELAHQRRVDRLHGASSAPSVRYVIVSVWLCRWEAPSGDGAISPNE
jgi:hypothetical protein